MTHPLASISRQIVVSGSLKTGLTNTRDSKGNPVFNFQQIQLLLMVKTLKDQQYFRSLYTVENTRKVVELYPQQLWFVINGVTNEKPLDQININDISPQLISLDKKVKFDIVDRNQSNITIITDIFGQRMIAVQDGFL